VKLIIPDRYSSSLKPVGGVMSEPVETNLTKARRETVSSSFWERPYLLDEKS